MRHCRCAKILLLLAGYILLIQVGGVVAQDRPPLRVTTPPDGCTVYGTAEPENLYSFIRFQIQALALAHAGERANSKVLTAINNLPPVQDVPKTMNGLKKEREGNTCAAFVISDYVGSKDETIASLARFLVISYQELGKMSDEMFGMVIQGATRTGARRLGPDQLAQWRAKRRKILDLMTDAVKLSLSMLIDKSGGEGKKDRLILSHSQRNELSAYLVSRFPALAHEGLAESYSDFTRQAALIQSFLAGNDQQDNVK